MNIENSLIADAAVRITLRHKFWSEIFYSCGVVTDAKHVDTAATDGRNLFINPEFYAKQNLDQKVTVVLHELFHKVFLHPIRRGNRKPSLWGRAADEVTNNFLKANRHPEPAGLVGGWICSEKYSDPMVWTVDAVYADLLKDLPNHPELDEMPNMADILASNMSPEETEKYETEIHALVERAIANAKARGDLPAGIEANAVSCFRPAEENWFNALHRYMQSLSNSEYNWARLNRRTLRSHGTFSPLHQSEALGDIAVFIDTSGSCFDAAEQANFCGHLNAILSETRPRRIHVYYFDTVVYPGETLDAGELDITTRPKGGGGTDFSGLFNALADDGVVPEVAIVLTDLYGSFAPQAPEYPLIWACTSDEIAPYGETLRIA